VVTADETYAAVKGIFEDMGCIVDPNGALALAGLKKWIKRNPCHRYEHDLVATATSVNIDFDSLRFISGCTALSNDKNVSSAG
jgi:threonine dehydratase